MCGRFTATFEFSHIQVRWNLDCDLPPYKPRFNISPEQTFPNIPVIVRHKGGNECRLMHWGLIPHWVEDPSIGNQMINARAETLTELPSFKLLVDRYRCIIPADGFYEWRKEGKRKVPMWVHLRSREPFALAGLWDIWRKPDGRKLESFTIITTEPNELIQPIHNRMPVILRPDDEEQWLDTSRTFVKAKSLLKPYPEELMDAHDVSPIVNSAKYDGPECIQPVSDEDIPRTGQLSLL
ncbi:MAG TPA: SOS response-associated peptidase [Candidatus Binatia bacterium]|nr:SOS response-associated peptidase [Candidatus Binatia bacterium]